MPSPTQKIRTAGINEDLTEKQKLCAQLLQEGELTKTQIAEKIGIDRNTVTNWEKKPKFEAYRRELADEKLRMVKAQIAENSTLAMKILINLMKTKDSRTQVEVAKYLIDRYMGKPCVKIDANENVTVKDDFDLDSVLAEIRERKNKSE